MQLTFTKIWDAIVGMASPRAQAERGRAGAEPVAQASGLKRRNRRPAQVLVESGPTARAVGSARVTSVASASGGRAMAAKYDAMMRDLLESHGIRVRKWRTSMSGVAWSVRYRDGRVVKLIESPKPVGPMSAAVFCHEIGHHAIGFEVYKPRCLEEYHAWAWAIAEMQRRGLNVTDKVRERMRKSLEYAVAKSLRRGIKEIPEELLPYVAGAQRYLR